MTTDTRKTGPDLRIVAAVFAIAVVTLLIRSFWGRGGEPFFADTDDAMRMVVVRDFIHGQNWFDLTAHRLNTPWGAELHWSRLVDLPIGLLLMLFTPLLGADTALVAVGAIWPMFLLGILLWFSALLANRLVGPEGVLPAVILPILSPAVTNEFVPGRVDHHNVVVLLTVMMIWAAVEAMRRPRFALFCGVIAATALAIATESLPPIAAAIVVMGLAWVFDTGRARIMRLFGIGFALASLIHLAIFRPPSRWLEAACDVISPFYVGIALVVGLVFTLASYLPLRAAWQRFATLAVLGLAGLAVMVLLYPQCLGGPYGELDPWLQANWISRIVEARPLFASMVDLPSYTIAVALPVLLAIVVMCVRLWREPAQRDEWAVLLVFLLFTSLVMLIQIRGARLAIMPAMPAAAWLIVVARQRYLKRQRLPQILGLIGSWLLFAGVVLSVTVAVVELSLPGNSQEVSEARAGKDACLLPSAFTDFAGLPPERIMTPIDLGAHMMLYTPHEVVSAPYHRNQRGVRDTFRFFNDPIAEARQILTERGIGLVVICPGMPEVAGLESRAPDSFANLFAAGDIPAWLDDVSLPDSPLRVFAVLPD